MTTTAFNASLSDRATYYPMTPGELMSLQKALSPRAFTLLLFIKSIAPFGKKIFFTDEINPTAIRKELEMDRTTFWRAKRELLNLQMIEFNDHYLRDCQTVDRAQFKKCDNDEPAEIKFSDLPIFQGFRALTVVTRPKPLLQNCNDLASEPAQGKHSGTPKPVLREYKKTTKHEQQPRTESVDCFSELPLKENQEDDRDRTSNAVPVAAKPSINPKDSGCDRFFPGEFLQFETIVKDWGASLNQNLLKAFYEAGVEKVRKAIDYVTFKLASAPGSIKNAVAYLVSLLRSGEVLNVPQSKPGELDPVIIKKFINWVDRAKDAGVINASRQNKETGRLEVFMSDGEIEDGLEMMEKYWID